MASPRRPRSARAGGLIWARRTAAGWEGQGVKAFGAEGLAALGGDEGDLLLAVVGADPLTSAGAARCAHGAGQAA